jgi:general L-amino acid transport system permease protein
VTATSRPPLWRDVRVLRWLFQLAVVGIVVAVVAVLYTNVTRNSQRLNIPTDFGYLDNPSQFPIPDSGFNQNQPVQDALLVGLANTVRVSVAGMVLATILGTVVGVARLSGNWLIRTAAAVYVETIRNIPLLLVVIFSYGTLAIATFPRIEAAWQPGGIAILSNRGVYVPAIERAPAFLVTLAVAVAVAWAVNRRRRSVADRTGEPSRAGPAALLAGTAVMAAGWLLAGSGFDVPELEGRVASGGVRVSPELFAIGFALVIYTASHIAEIVRGSIQAVASGQGEAAWALALSPFQRLRDVVLPQAFRIAVPPLGNQYLNLTKNSTLGAVVSYYELAQVTSISVGNGAPAVPSYLLVLVVFVVLSLAISAAVNVMNRRLAVAR